MKMKIKRRAFQNIIYSAVIVICVIIDQLTKLAAVGRFEKEWESFTVIPGILDFTYVLNEGATAGILADQRWIFMSVSTVAIIVMLCYMFITKKLEWLSGISLGMIVGGGIGNMIDRVARGAVVDFFDVTCSDVFPFNTIFNVADSFVCVGCALLVLALIIDEVHETKAKKEAKLKAEKDSLPEIENDEA